MASMWMPAAYSAFLLLVVTEPVIAATPVIPPVVTQYVATFDQACLKAGGKPGDANKAIRQIDLTGDGITDFLVDGGAYDCQGAADALADDQARKPLAIFVSASPDGGTTSKAYETHAYGSGLAPHGLELRPLIRLAAAACASAPSAQQAMNEVRFCDQPLNWDATSQRFEPAPAMEWQPIQ